ncbi:hypothetical protein L1987_49059 [Smallanthus sonchifolius]|uniref:Uncharacterized protein n=1 Tax=Smallanthus sonchifolius TaxID=185202 RepID=A0ACB9FU60_9ASTR|nr:hypothetical protein L1987_49059 [Smallanthus sonchifolius]
MPRKTLLCCHSKQTTKDNITTGEFIDDGLSYLESPGMKFRMGFFPHGNTSELRRYVGIWYTMDPKTVVWVANRDKPVLDSTGVLTVAKDGNFKVLNKDQTIYFEITTEGAPLTTLKLLDTGNVVLINVVSGSILWQSFETPTDTFLPGMIMGTNMTLISWKGITDPGFGSFEFQQDQGTTQYSILNGSTKFLWKSGKMSTNSFGENQIFSKAFNLLSNSTTQKRNIILKNGTRSSETYTVVDPNSRLVTGKLQYLTWSKVNSQWVLEWEEPKDNCSSYRVCGPFGMCGRNNDSLCSCLPGFEPNSPDDPTGGCKRTSKICERSSIKDTLINITMISMDDPTLCLFETNNESECIKECLKDCVCLAYAYSSRNEEGIRDPSRKNTHGCWFGDTEPNNLKGEGTHNISFCVSESSKEYALDGLFSIKSDVFSFRVVLLEIAWSLWIEDKPFELLDQILMKSCNSSEVLKCIIIRLLCVQGDPDERPTMTNVVMMLGGDMATLPNPKEPAFIPRRDHAISSSSSSSKQDTQTKNMLPITEVAGR